MASSEAVVYNTKVSAIAFVFSLASNHEYTQLNLLSDAFLEQTTNSLNDMDGIAYY